MRRLALAAFALAGLAFLLAACALRVDEEQARLCRTIIPALNAEGAEISLTRTVPGPGANDVSISYRAAAPGLPAFNRLIICRFAGDGVSTQRNDLRGVATEDGPLNESSFYLLKRFYLADPTIAALDPAPPVSASARPSVPFWLAYGAQFAVSALPSMVIYGLLAAAYALLFGLIGRVVLGFGEFAALGGGAMLLSATLAASVVDLRAALAVGGLVAACAAGLHGLVIGRFVIGRLHAATGQQVVIATVGLSLALSEYLRLTQGAVTAWIAPVWNTPIELLTSADFSTTITPITLLVAGCGLAASAALMALMRFSGFGRMWRAYSDDPLAAALMGIDGRRLLDLTFALACLLSGLAGVLVAILFGAVGFAGGFALGLKALIAAVIGGIGSVPGAFVGGVLLAVVEVLWVVLLPVDFRDISLYSLLVVFLIWRPSGLFGRDATPRQNGP